MTVSLPESIYLCWFPKLPSALLMLLWRFGTWHASSVCLYHSFYFSQEAGQERYKGTTPSAAADVPPTGAPYRWRSDRWHQSRAAHSSPPIGRGNDADHLPRSQLQHPGTYHTQNIFGHILFFLMQWHCLLDNRSYKTNIPNVLE